MFHLRWKLIQLFIFLLDLGIAILSFWLAHLIRFRLQEPEFPAMGDFEAHKVYLPMVLLLWTSILFVSPFLYRIEPTRRFSDESSSVILTGLASTFAIFALAFGLKWKELSRTLIALFGFIDVTLMIGLRGLLWLAFGQMKERGYSFCSLLLVGSSRRVQEFFGKIDRFKHWGLKVEGIATLEAEPHNPSPSPTLPPWLGTLKDIPRLLKTKVIDEVVFLASESSLKHIPEILAMCEFEGIRLRVVADFFPNRRSSRLSLALLDSVPLITFSHTPDEAAFLIAKRLIDFLGSLIALFLFAPLMLLVALAIRLDSPGPVFFAQERCGLRGRRFKLLKFRSMVIDAHLRLEELRTLNEMDGPVFKLRNDPRVTRVGRWLRKTSIDELPQFFNVLLGHMSLVGPRPPLPSEVQGYDDWHRRRLSVKPGITCLWQVSGRNNVEFRRWMEMDLEYIDNCSLWMDVKILAKTLPAVLSGRGAS